MSLPNVAYYRAHEGSWSAAVAVHVTSWRAFFASPMSLLDRLSGLWMGLVVRWTGLRMHTTVDCTDEREVVHTTAASVWGMTVFRSVERLALHEDGLQVRMSGEQFLWPTWRAVPHGEGHVQIAQDAQSARYTFDWMGGRLLQQTRVVPEGLHIEQQNDWFRASGVLRRA